MDETCQAHKAIVDILNDKVSKSSIKWLATLFALPAIIAVLATYAFITNADYRFGSAIQAQTNMANIKLLDERMLTLRSDMMKLQTDQSADLIQIKADLREIAKELRQHNFDSRVK